MRALTSRIRDLSLVTADRGMPDRPDRRPIDLPRRAQVVTFTRTVDRGQITADSVGIYGAFAFALADLPSYTDFTSLFDQYRIAQVTMRFIPVVAPFGPATSATAYPSLHTVIDQDDNVTPGSLDVLRQYGTHQVTPNQVYFERCLTPRYALSAYSGIFGSFALAPVNSFIDSNSPNVQYYGVKWGTSAITSTGTYVLYNVEATYVLQCRSII